jgi:hypothetical protein
LTPFLILTSGLLFNPGEFPLIVVGLASGVITIVNDFYLVVENSATYLGLAIDLIAIGEIGECGS